MIEIKNLSKTFADAKRQVHAVKDVSLTIQDGEIFGVIGYSGAGKSTLVRCINLLEKPTQGQVIINGTDITKLKDKELRGERKKIGMIFQQFNLLSSLTVGQNVAFNLKGQGLEKKAIDKRVDELLDLVGISEKKSAYPSQLSGGQKQRVAIARALANNPDILLCDEATSALDPQTTNQILTLLKQLNRTLNITIIIITHEMNVIKSICDRVAVMENGNVAETGTVLELFSAPKSEIAKQFIRSTTRIEHIEELLAGGGTLLPAAEDQVLLKLRFFGPSTREALIHEVSQKYQTSFNIAFADTELIQGQVLGWIVLAMKGEAKARELSIQAFQEKGLYVEVLQ